MSNVIDTTPEISRIDLLERAGDWLNPILIKEARQALKSRQFIITFLLMLIASWLISIFGTMMAGESLEYGSAGRGFFVFYYIVLALAIFAVVPYTAYRSLLSERDQTTLELLSITALTPRQLVWGKLGSSMMQVFIYYSAIAPFIAFTSMLQGFDLAMVAFALSVSLLITLCMTMLALTLAAVPQNKHMQGGTSLIVFGGLVWVVCIVIFGAAQLLMETIPFDEPGFWVGIGCFVALALSTFFLLTQIATAHLTFESDNRSTGIRIACSAQFVLYWAAVFITKLTLGRPPFSVPEVALIIACWPTGYCLFVGFFASTEPDYVSRRVRRGIPQNGLLRLLAIPYLPGGHRGFVYFLLHITSIPILIFLLFDSSWINWRWQNWQTQWLLTLFAYTLIYLGLGSAFGRLLRHLSSEVRPMHVRVLIVMFVLFGLLLPLFPAVFFSKEVEQQLRFLRVTNPFMMLDEMDNFTIYPVETLEKVVVWLAALLGILLNTPSMLIGAIEVLNPPAHRSSKLDNADHDRRAAGVSDL